MRNSLQTIALVLATSALAASTFGCHAKEARAKHEDVYALDLKSFPGVAGSKVSLTDNKVFFWKSILSADEATRGVAPMTREEVALASYNGRRVDELEENLRELQVPIREINSQIEALNAPVAEVRARVEEIKGLLDDPMSPPEGDEKTRLEAELAEKSQMLAPVDAAVARKSEERAGYESAQEGKLRDTVNAGIAIAKAMQTAPIPKRIRLLFGENGAPSVRLDSTWIEARLNSSGDGFENVESEPVVAVKNVSYAELAGKLVFNVEVFSSDRPGERIESWEFKLHRIRYSATERDGRVIFGGDVVKTFADGRVHKGTAKFKTEL